MTSRPSLEGEQAIEGRYADNAKERTFHHGPNCPRQFAWRPNICPQSVVVHTARTPLAAGMGPYMLPLHLRVPLRHGSKRTEEVVRWQQKHSNPYARGCGAGRVRRAGVMNGGQWM